jgi:flagellar biogenesis protein FliO
MPTGLIQPLEVPWSIESIYGKNAIKEPPDNQVLILVGLLAGLLLILFLVYLVIKRIRSMSIEPTQRLPVKIQHVK